jgi:iron complex outermembrane receptor protein
MDFHVKPGFTDFSQLESVGQTPYHQLQLRSEINLTSEWEFDTALREVGQVHGSAAGSYTEADARIGWKFSSTGEISLDGFNLLHPRHVELIDPSTAAPRYISRSIFLELRQRF